ncbi:MAG: calcium-binding protein, partial [Cyanobacteria bacterium J06631_6]
LGNDTIDGGAGFDVLRLDFSFLPPEARVLSEMTSINRGEYSDGFGTIKFRNIEAIDVIGSTQDDVLVAPTGSSNVGNFDEPMPYPMNSTIDGGEGKDRLVVDYSESNEDLMLHLHSNQNYTGFDYPSLDGSINAHSYMGEYNSNIEFNNIESFSFTTGSGNDEIDIGYDNFSDDVVDAGAGDDFIFAGLGNDTIDGGSGSDRYIYELGHGTDIISDSHGENDTIYFGAGIDLGRLNVNFEDNDLVFSMTDSLEDRLVVENYAASADSIESIDIQGQIFSTEEIIALKSEPQPETIGEFGQVNNFDHNSQTIEFDRNYENPVVFALPLSRNGSAPSVVRITDIQDDSFTAYLQEAEYNDGVHTKESFSYMVLEAGTWELDNGALLEVGNVDTHLVTAQGWSEIDFAADFADTPVVLSQVQSNNDAQFVRTRQKQSSIDGFSLSLEEEEALRKSGHAQETVGWLAIDAGEGDWGELQYEAGHTGRKVNHRYHSLEFEQEFTNEPSLFASLASFYGSGAAGLRYKNLDETRVHIMVEEDQSFDREMLHTREVVDFLAIAGTGDLSAIAYEADGLG